MGRFNIEQGQIETKGRDAAVFARPQLMRKTSERPAASNGIAHLVAAPANVLMRQLPPPLKKRLEQHQKTVALKSGQFLYRPDEPIEWVYFPENAVISELQILEDGRTVEVALTGRESAVGLSAVYGPGRAANWMQVCAAGIASKIQSEALRRETAAVPWAKALFHEAVQSYIAQISQKAACNAHHSVQQRFAMWLLTLQERSRAPRLTLTQEQIARALGVYRPSVTCIAQELRELGLIDYVRGNIVILDRDGLTMRSCGCYLETAVGTRRSN